MQQRSLLYTNAIAGYSLLNQAHRHAYFIGTQRFSKVGIREVGLHRHCPRPSPPLQQKLAVILDDTEASTSGRDSDDELKQATAEYIDQCQEQFGIDDLISVSAGLNGDPVVTLRHPNGASADICLHGAVVSSWQRPDGRQLLHLRKDRAGIGGDAVRGGIQIAWPQYGAGVLPTHGLLKDLHWSITETAASDNPDDPRPTVILYARSEESTEDQWPHAFQAMYSVTLMKAPPPPEDPRQQAREFDKIHEQLWDEALLQQMPGKKVRLAMAEKKAQMESDEALAELELASANATAAAAANAAGNKTRKKKGTAADATTPSTSTTTSTSTVPAAGGEWNYSGMVGEDGEMIMHTESEPEKLPSMALRITLQIENDSDREMMFTGGIRQHWATQDIPSHPKFVKVLGLGGKYVLDYAKDQLRPRMGIENSDFVFFNEGKDTLRVYVDAGQEGQVMFCPGDRTHVDVKSIAGFTDIGLEHAGNSDPDESAKHVTLVAAKKACPARLAPGEVWTADVLLAEHDDYWPLPMFERENPETVPLPPREDALPTRRGGGGGESDISEMLQ